MRSIRTPILFGFVLSSAIVSGCISERAAKEFGTALGEAFAAPLNVIAQNMSGSQELAYATAAFQRRNRRWPKDYPELSLFVQQTDGLLLLGEYDQVDFSESPDGALHVAFVPCGQTNQMSFTFPSKDGDKK